MPSYFSKRVSAWLTYRKKGGLTRFACQHQWQRHQSVGAIRNRICPLSGGQWKETQVPESTSLVEARKHSLRTNVRGCHRLDSQSYSTDSKVRPGPVLKMLSEEAHQFGRTAHFQHNELPGHFLPGLQSALVNCKVCSCSLTQWPIQWLTVKNPEQQSGKGLSCDACWPLLAEAEQSPLHALSLRMYLVIPGPSKAPHRKTKPCCTLVPLKPWATGLWAWRCFLPLQFSLLVGGVQSLTAHCPARGKKPVF